MIAEPDNARESLWLVILEIDVSERIVDRCSAWDCDYMLVDRDRSSWTGDRLQALNVALGNWMRICDAV